jgi:hypothetical protein
MTSQVHGSRNVDLVHRFPHLLISKEVNVRVATNLICPVTHLRKLFPKYFLNESSEAIGLGATNGMAQANVALQDGYL